MLDFNDYVQKKQEDKEACLAAVREKRIGRRDKGCRVGFIRFKSETR